MAISRFSRCTLIFPGFPVSSGNPDNEVKNSTCPSGRVTQKLTCPYENQLTLDYCLTNIYILILNNSIESFNKCLFI